MVKEKINKPFYEDKFWVMNFISVNVNFETNVLQKPNNI